jgi:predicted SAM-dependent methyltransferase
MKFNLHCNNQGLKGYENYESRPTFIDEAAGIHASMDRYLFSNVEDGTVDEIIVNVGCLGSLHRQEVAPTIASWYRILAPGGRARIVFNDLYMVTDALNYDQVDHLMFEQTFVQYNSYHTFKEMVELTESAGFTLGEAYYGVGGNDHVCVVEVIKPKE